MRQQQTQSKAQSSRFFQRRDHVKPGSAERSSLQFETLESRELLAANAAEIIGVVTADLDADGDATDHVVVAGAIATLHRDNGDGVFSAADPVIQSGVVTDSAGQYRFEGVAAGNYFIEITPPDDMHFRPGESVRAISVSDTEADTVVGRAIDNFESNQRATASPPLPSSDPSRLTDSSVMGGQRDLFVRLTDGDDVFSSVSIVTGGGLMRLASDTTVTGDAKIVWDGVDSSAEGVNPVGLGGLDLTQHERSKMTGISLTVGADHPNSRVTLRVYSDANNWTEFEATVPESPGGAATKHLVFGFKDSPAEIRGAGADFANVGAIELTFEGVSAVDGQVSLVGLVGHTVKELDFVVSPRLGLGDLVFNDVNNNGILDSGEPGLGDVKLNLYEDVDGNNRYENSVDRFLGMTTTDPSGHYQFADLFPGNYLVQVAEENFQSGKALAELRTSTGNDPVSDPDNNVDGDDNGAALAGGSVVSQAITLTGGDEPTGDGDHNNSNRTLDFGFYGFDLVLEKSVEVGDGNDVAPAAPLGYTIIIKNNGPSTALDVQFEDVLPAQTSFRSASANNGALVSQSGGRLRADLGAMASGDSVTLTIVVDVASSAGGILVNEATVTASGEVNLVNNTDRVENPIDPQIDLTVKKSDSDDPVDSGDTFQYTLTAINNGPSDATGVQLVDYLPQGLSFVSASRPPASTVGGILRFDLGNLASGDDDSVEVTVKVDDDFFGTLLNRVEVSANETELNYANNEDEEPTTVRPKIDLEILKSDSDGPIRPGDTFRYTLEIRNHGPADATGVTVVDTLPASGIEFQGASQTPASVDGREVAFDLGSLAAGDGREIEISVAVDQSFAGVLLNTAEVSGNETETRYDNNVDDVQTQVAAEPGSLSGNVYVDSNDNGVIELGEAPISGVVITLTGNDFTGAAVNRTATTDARGRYLFDNVLPGEYNLVETQPARYRDGKDSVGDNGDGITTPADGLVALDLNDFDDMDADAIGGIVLAGGAHGTDYNFGELSNHLGPNKVDLLVPIRW